MHSMRNVQIRANALCDLRFPQVVAGVMGCKDRA